MRFVIAIALALVAAAAAAAEPVAFRGAQLGITLAELRALQFPDDAHGSPTLQCNDFTSYVNFPEEIIQSMKRFVALGVVACEWETKDGANAYVGVGHFASDDASYFVYRAPDGQQRLYQIKIGLPSGQAEGLLASLSKKFGEPSIERSEIQNKMGAKFPNFVATWHQAGDSIKLEQRAGSMANSAHPPIDSNTE